MICISDNSISSLIRSFEFLRYNRKFLHTKRLNEWATSGNNPNNVDGHGLVRTILYLRLCHIRTYNRHYKRFEYDPMVIDEAAQLFGVWQMVKTLDFLRRNTVGHAIAIIDQLQAILFDDIKSKSPEYAAAFWG